MRLKTALTLAACAALAACRHDTNDATPDNEQEVITNVTVTVQDSGVSGALPRNFTFSDPDGPGGNPPTTTDIGLNKGRSAYVSLTLTDASQIPPADITQEIRTEQNVHQFFFAVTGTGLRVRYDPSDYDGNTPAKPVGLKSIWHADSGGNGQIRIILKHQPGLKPAISNTLGDSTKGETDVDAAFSFSVN